ncbi:transglutaminase family protein [uncultured Microscilla sp.]|uniref:transglutaminase-like domain-containing protein n=1 Tax=uncultured Microscilla sp. TaxID=432653 RepID=UPI0026077073|nr:transglutaminase-like domain-containing protein [uncultured Microscilla sp.]
MKILHFYLLLLCFSFLPGAIIGQNKTYRQASPASLSSMLLESSITYEFVWDKHYQLPQVIELTLDRVIGLEPQQTLYRAKFYDQHSRIVKAECLNSDGQLQKMGTVLCGNHSIQGIFYSDAQICRYPLEFKNAGQTLSLKTLKQYNDVKYLTSVYFHEDLPTSTKKIVFIIPEWMEVELKEFNFEPFAVSKTKKYLAHRKAWQHTYEAHNLTALSREHFMPGNSHVYPHILVLAKSFTKNQQRQTLLASTDDLYAWYSSLTDQVKNHPQNLRPLLRHVIEGKQGDLDKIKAIYYWVQDNIRYIAFEDGIAGFKPQSANKVFDQKYGDCKGMANLTKALLKLAGYDARLTWIGTNHLAYDYSIPSLAVDNHMVCTVWLKGKRYILDATEKFNALGDYAERIQGRPILIENGDKYILDKVPVLSNTRNLVIGTQKAFIKDGALQGKGSMELSGENKQMLLYYLHTTPTQRRSRFIKGVISSRNPNFEVLSSQTSNVNNREQPFEIQYRFQNKAQVNEFGNELYIDIDYAKEYKASIIDTNRLSYVKFPEKVLNLTNITLNIPKGYKIKHLPTNMEFMHHKFSFRVKFEQKQGKILYVKEIVVGDGIIPKECFKTWNECIIQLNKIYEDQVVLVKE